MKCLLTPLLLTVALLAPGASFAQDGFPDAEAPPEGGEPEPVDPAGPDGDGDVDPLAPDPADEFDFAPDAPPPDDDPMPPGEEPDLPPATSNKGSTSWARVSAVGLSGFGQMITTDELPEDLTIRVSFGFETQHTEVRFDPGTFRINGNAQIYMLGVGVGLMEMIEISLQVPLVDWELVSHNGGGPAEDKFGMGNPEIAVRFMFPLKMDMIKIGAYFRAQLGLGTHRVFRPRRIPFEEGEVGEFEIGVIASLDLDIATIYTNLAFRDIEDDADFRPSSSYRWRVGATLDPTDMISVGLYFDFEEFEGSVRMNDYVGLNVDVFVNDMIVVSAGFEYLMLGDALDDMVAPGAKDEERYFAFNFGVSALF